MFKLGINVASRSYETNSQNIYWFPGPILRTLLENPFKSVRNITWCTSTAQVIHVFLVVVFD